MTVLTAQPTIYMTPNETRNIALSFVGKLTEDDLLTGTPTLAISAGGPSLGNGTINSSTLHMQIPDNEHYAKPSQAVMFRATASATSAATYTATITCSTTGGQILQEFVTIVVSTS